MATIPIEAIEVEARRLDEVLRRFERTPAWAQLRIRIREMSEKNERDEVKQYEVLRHVARRNPLLLDALLDAKFALDTNWSDRNIDPAEGMLVQAFNHWIEVIARWDRS